MKEIATYLAVLAICIASFAIGIGTGKERYRREGRIEALYDVSIDANMAYLMCLSDRCGPEAETRKLINHIVDRRLEKEGIHRPERNNGAD